MERFKIQILFSQYFSKEDFRDIPDAQIREQLLEDLGNPDPYLDPTHGEIEFRVEEQGVSKCDIEDFESHWHRSFCFNAVVVTEDGNKFLRYLEEQECFDNKDNEFLAHEFAMRFIEGIDYLILMDEETGKDYVIDTSKSRADGEVERLE